MTWTEERVERLRRYWAEGESASRIAELLGGFEHCHDRGRNAVIGKVHRLGLAGRETVVAKRRRTGEREGRSEGVRGKTEDVVRLVPPDTCSLEPVSLDVPLTELRPGQCRWPHGDGPFLFCGHTAEAGAVYCPFHRRLAYRPAERQAEPFVILGPRRNAA